MALILLSKDTVVARFDDAQHMIWRNETLLPLYFKRTSNLDGWLRSRAIDSHRANSRLLKKALRLTERDDASTALAVNAVTVTDTYWVKDENSSLTWDEVCFKKDYFSKLALTGNYDSFVSTQKKHDHRTQELTNIGSFEKCWRLIDGTWWMYKQADSLELFSEYFVYLLGKYFGFNMAVYEPVNDYVRPKVRCIRTRDFTKGATVNFEPLDSIMGDDVEDYSRTYHRLEGFGKEIASDYVSIIFMDAICANPDRHSFNLGVLRNVETGKVLCMAPNFDNNMALISRGYPSIRSRGSDLLISDFNALLHEGVYWAGYSENRMLPKLDKETLKRIAAETHIRVRTTDVTDFVWARYKNISFS